MPATGRRRNSKRRNHKRQKNISSKQTTSHNEKYTLLFPRLQDVIYALYSSNRTHFLWITHVTAVLAPFFIPHSPAHILHFIKTHPEYLQIHNHQIVVFSPSKQSMCELRRKCKNPKCKKVHASSNRRSYEASTFRFQHIFSVNSRECENLFHDFCRGYDVYRTHARARVYIHAFVRYKKNRAYQKYPRSKKSTEPFSRCSR